MSVEWRKVPGYPGISAGSNGKIRFEKNGYETLGGVAGKYRRVSVVVCDKTNKRELCYVHDLVCRAFHGPRPKGAVVLHAKDNKLDNRPSKLSWGSQSANVTDAYRNGMVEGKGANRDSD